MLEELASQRLSDVTLDRFIIDSDDAACVLEDHSAEHALLVLIKSGYSSIPVLNVQSEVVGIISKTLLLDNVLGLERIEVERLGDFRVRDVMNTQVPRIETDQTVFRALQLSINAPFLCVVKSDRTFHGILTRRSLLALLHQEWRHDLDDKRKS